MSRTLIRFKSELVMLASLLALWPVFVWYTDRMLDGSDESFGLLALVTALAFVFIQRVDYRSREISLTPVYLLMVAYIVSLFLLPPILRAAIAMTLIGVLLSRRYFAQGLHFGLWGLLLLSLPVMASVQFYLGYPLRWVVGYMAKHLLQLNGLAVTHSGTLLNWSGGTVSIDAPCSGIKMLWFGLYLCFTLACLYRLSSRRLVVLGVTTFMVIVAANTLRATALFYIESRLLAMPDWAHNAVGIMMYLVGAISIVYLGNRLSARYATCVA